MSTQILTYCGGMPEIKKSCDLAVNAMPDHVGLYIGLTGKHKIPYASITGISMKTNEQISKDVTLTRLLLLGVFAFGAKKKTKETTNYLVIDYTDCGIATSAIFSGNHVPKICSELLSARKAYFEKHPESLSPAPAKESESPEVDCVSEIERFFKLKEKGIITEQEFSAKKAQLLNIV